MKINTYKQEIIKLKKRLNQICCTIKASGGNTVAGTIEYNVLNYNELLTIPDPDLYVFAYVRESQGTKWLPGTIGGTYYGSGLYMWDGLNWTEDDTGIFEELTKKQDLLISGTNIKTVNSNTLLGSGNIIIPPGADGYTPIKGVDYFDGINGTDGVGIPIGGTTGQIISKIDATDYNTEWVTLSDGTIPYCKYRNETSQSVDSTSDSQLNWNITENEDAPFSMVTNVLTVNETALYLINLSLNLYGTTVINRYGGVVSVYVDGVPILNTFQGGYIRGDSGHTVGQIVGVLPVYLTAGQTLEFYIRRTHSLTTDTIVDTGSTLSIMQLKTQGPKGDPGIQGADGDMTWQGAWSAGTYFKDNVVQKDGSSYVCIAPISTTQEPPDTEWELVASKGDVGPTGATAPYSHFIKVSTQNIGGADGTVSYIDWDDTPIILGTGFTHSTVTNPSRIQVDSTGRYEIKANVQAVQTGASRTTLMSGLRINGVTSNDLGRQRNYSRGAGYGDLGVGLFTEIDLIAGDYIEMTVTVDDTDGAYTINTISTECEFIIRKIS
jgi:hypothetical protein